MGSLTSSKSVLTISFGTEKCVFGLDICVNQVLLLAPHLVLVHALAAARQVCASVAVRPGVVFGEAFLPRACLVRFSKIRQSKVRAISTLFDGYIDLMQPQVRALLCSEWRKVPACASAADAS